MSPNGQSADAEPDEIEKRMRAQMRNIGIPPRPAILDRINGEMGKSDPDFQLLATAIGSDVGLAGSLIKVANSPFFGFSRKVRSVQDALLVLGLKAVARTVAGLALRQMFPHVPSLERFWDASARTARVSGWLAQRLQGRHRIAAEDAHTFGLFRDCGIPVLMIPFPDYQQILRQANAETQSSFTDVEDRLLSLNHAGIGADLAADWMLPPEIVLAIRHHHDAAALRGQTPEDLPALSRRIIAAAQIAEHLVQRQTGLNQNAEWSKLGDLCLEQLGLGPDELAALYEDCREAVAAEQ